MEMRGENCLVAFNLRHLHHSVSGVLGEDGVQEPTLGLVGGYYPPTLGRENVPEDKRRGSGTSF